MDIFKLFEHFPDKFWFIEIISANKDELLPEEFVKKYSNLITSIYESNDPSDYHSELEVVYHLSWEKINTGMYEDVPITWRQVFALSCLLLVFVNLKSLTKDFDSDLLIKCLYLCDMSLIMGGEINSDLNLGSKIARDLHSLISQNCEISEKCETSFVKESFFDPYKNISSEIRFNIEPLAKIESPSITEFLAIVENGKPVILTNIISNWPALSTNKWSVNFIRKTCGYRTVPIEIGSTYADEDWSQKLMKINDFIDEYFYEPKSKSKAYLAQHYLFSQIDELSDDIIIPDYCFMGANSEQNEVDINAWFGPAGTVSPLHQDPKPNFLCQVFGEKYLKLYLPEQTEFLYPNSTTMLKNTSKVDVMNPDLESFPLFSKAKGFDGILKSGEVLFIPPKCWHYVKSLSCSFSVNFWWTNK